MKFIIPWANPKIDGSIYSKIKQIQILAMFTMFAIVV